MRGLTVGRFQPYHRGHHQVVTDQAGDLDALTVVIGSSLESHTPQDPFTAGERLRMIRRSLDADGVEDVTVLPVPDVDRNALWVSHVESQVPPFDVFLSNNGLPRRLFAEAGYEVRDLPFHQREKYEGTRIRRLMREGGDWEPLVPDPTADVIREVDGPERLRLVAGDDTAGER